MRCCVATRRFLLIAAAIVVVGSGCQSRTMRATGGPTGHGMLGHAREVALDERVRPNDRLLREATLGILTLVDGLPQQAEEPMNRAYEMLRTRGVNEGRDGAAVVLHEGVRVWKGEPYEQAMVLTYIAVQKAMLGEWGNARAAAGSALELLDEFDSARGVARQLPAEATGFVVSQSDFVPALLMAGVANAALGRGDEAADYFDRVLRVRPRLGSVVETLRSGAYDALMIVEMGIGPTIETSGGDGASTRLGWNWPSDEREVVVRTSSGVSVSAGLGLDVNWFAEAYRWDHLAGARRFKSGLGTVMAGTGIVMLGSDDEDVQWAGLGVLLAGLMTKATSKADTRGLSVLPQRWYFVPVVLDGSDAIEVEIGGGVGERMVFPTPVPSRAGPVVVLSRIAADAAFRDSGRSLEDWGGERYSPNELVRVPGDDLPYILGGRCVMEPGPAALAKYQAAGHLTGMTSADLAELYRAEGIALSGEVPLGVPPGRHLLEGGSSLAVPVRGSLGYVRLFCREHRAFRPRSEQVKMLKREFGAEGVER